MSADRSPRNTFYEFFAGGGMVRAGLSEGWDCLFANDIDAKKAASYAANWGDEHLKVADVGLLTTADLPGRADLAWASFPCQDLSLAGDYAGLKGARSGTFWPFWRLMQALASDGRAPALIALENVCGALTSHDGKDFAAIGAALGRRLPLRRSRDGRRSFSAAVPPQALHNRGSRRPWRRGPPDHDTTRSALAFRKLGERL